jgi:hypothetical protein
MRYILSPLIACGEGVGGGVIVPHNIGKCCNLTPTKNPDSLKKSGFWKIFNSA